MKQLADHIVDTKAGHFDPGKFEDHYETALVQLLRAKQKGKEFKVHVFINPADPTVSLSDIPPSAISYGANAHLFHDGPQFLAITRRSPGPFNPCSSFRSGCSS